VAGNECCICCICLYWYDLFVCAMSALLTRVLFMCCASRRLHSAVGWWTRLTSDGTGYLPLSCLLCLLRYSSSWISRLRPLSSTARKTNLWLVSEYSGHFYYAYVSLLSPSAFSALVGRQEEHPACDVWLSVLSEVQLMPLHPSTQLFLASFKSRLVLPFSYHLTQVVREKRPLNGCSSSNSLPSPLLSNRQSCILSRVPVLVKDRRQWH